jgi:hypothetical protein
MAQREAEREEKQQQQATSNTKKQDKCTAKQWQA